LKGYVYDCSSYKQADNYNRTTKEIAEFVGRTYKYGSDARLAITNLAAPVFTEPADLAATGVSAARKRLWERQVDKLGKRESYLEENMKTIYSLVWGQCTEIMRQRLEALPSFNTMSTKGDSIGLLKAIKSLVYNFQSQKYLPHSLHLAAQQFYNCKQSKRMTTQSYIEEFQSRVDVIKESGGSIGHSPEMVKRLCKQKGTPLKDMDRAATLVIQKESEERYLAVAIMIGADRSRFGTLLEDLQNDYLQKRDNYPKTMAESYNLLTNWCTDARQPTSYHHAHDGMAFTNDGDGDEIPPAEANQNGTTLANDGKPRDKSTVRCNRCQTIGHYSSKCRAAAPKPRVYPASSDTATRATGEQMLMSAVASVKPDADSAKSNDSPPSDHNDMTAKQLLMSGVDNGEFDNQRYNGFQFLMQGTTNKSKSKNRRSVTLTNVNVNKQQQKQRRSVNFNTSQSSRIPKTWILLDNQSTVDVFHNDELLQNIREGTG
jgi:hypothetical protein